MTKPRRPTVLFCEDEPRLRKLIRHSLASRYHVVVAKDGEEGLAFARELLPAAIVTDVAMPVMDGFTLALELGTDHALRHIPLAFATGSAHRSAVLRFRPARRTTVLIKPYSVAHLRRFVDRLTGSEEA